MICDANSEMDQTTFSADLSKSESSSHIDMQNLGINHVLNSERMLADKMNMVNNFEQIQN